MAAIPTTTAILSATVSRRNKGQTTLAYSSSALVNGWVKSNGLRIGSPKKKKNEALFRLWKSGGVAATVSAKVSSSVHDFTVKVRFYCEE